MANTIRVEGLFEMQRAFGRIDKAVKKDMRKELVDVAEPVRAASTKNAVAGIRHIGGRWSGMRIGVTAKAVYVAPKAHRRGGSPRPNLRDLLQREMDAALDENAEVIVARLDHWLGILGDEAGF
jgi:hypothetical protein